MLGDKPGALPFQLLIVLTLQHQVWSLQHLHCSPDQEEKKLFIFCNSLWGQIEQIIIIIIIIQDIYEINNCKIFRLTCPFLVERLTFLAPRGIYKERKLGSSHDVLSQRPTGSRTTLTLSAQTATALISLRT